ncbi:DUF433 domain-containing protein [Rubellimicrobium rubrum]|nr:DUF433 domain-containing protein [Rubellimicrobium rubrum]
MSGHEWIDPRTSDSGSGPTVRGTELTVAGVVDMILAGVTPDEMCRRYPRVPRQAFAAAVDYALKLAQRAPLVRADRVPGMLVTQPEHGDSRVTFLDPDHPQPVAHLRNQHQANSQP